MGPARTAATALLAALVTLASLLAGPVPVAQAGPPTKDSDFARLPDRCYDTDGTTILDAPCRVLSFPGARPTLVVWGDSHAWMYLPAVRRLAQQHRVNLVFAIAGGCPPALASELGTEHPGVCEKHNERVLALVDRLAGRAAPLEVVIGGFWSGYRQAWRRIRAARATGTQSGLTPYEEHRAQLAVEGGPRLFALLGRRRYAVDVIGQAATVPLNPAPCPAGRNPYQCDLPRMQAMNRERDNRRWLGQQVARLAGSPRVIDATPAYCTALVCRAHVHGANTFYDDIHLAAGLTRQLAPYFRATFHDLTL